MADAPGGLTPAAWVAAAHARLAATAVPLVGACWGPARLRHRSARPEWFTPFDAAWARPVADVDVAGDVVGTAAARAPGAGPALDLCSGAIADVANTLGPPPRGDAVVAIGRAVHDGTVSAWDRASGRAVVLRTGPPDEYEQVTPLRPLVHWVALACGGVLVHAAAIGRPPRAPSDPPTRPARGVLVVGDAGFGKSTTTLAALARGWITAGDDAVMVLPVRTGPDGTAVPGTRWTAEAVYAAVKTKVGAAHPPPVGLPTRSWVIGGRKWVHRLTATDGRTLVDALDLVGVVVLDPGAGADAPVRRVSGARARTATAPSTVGALPDHQTEVLTRIGAVCGARPAFVLPRRDALDRTVADLDDILGAANDHMDPRVDVVIPVHDGAHLVGRALDSIVTQTAGRLRVIVVDDASTDDSVAVVEDWRARVEAAGHALVVHVHPENRGVAAARNRGLEGGDHPFVAFLDQDDRWTPDHVAVLHAALTESGADAVHGRVEYRTIDGSAPPAWTRPAWFAEDQPGHVFGAGLFRRTVFDRVGRIDETKGMFDDVDWYLRLLDGEVPPVVVERVVLERGVHPANQSRGSTRDHAGLLGSVRAHLARTRAAAPLRPDVNAPVRPDVNAPVRLDVVVPVRNGERFIGAAVASALAQEEADVHVVVVDDASTDGTAALVAGWADSRITLVRLDRHRGIGAARNAGVEAGGRPWLGFLDADDVWPPDRTARLAAALTATPAAIAVGRVHATVDPEGDPPDPGTVAALPAAVLAGGILARRSVLDRVGPFTEDLRVGEFVEWLARARLLGVAEVDVPVLALIRRLHPDSTTRTGRADYGDYLRAVGMVRARTRTATETETR
ncbi:MAG: glycosyltransferase [Actinobacteria bacterium]|nr:glycosyltransferase [Actinomycetota bacterium]